jgi:hypothetical protein
MLQYATIKNKGGPNMSMPIRLSAELLSEAKKHIKLTMRSVTKQIEFWAQIGKEIESNMTPADIVALVNGEAEIKVLRKKSEPVSFESVFDEIESDREEGRLRAKVVQDRVWYEESQSDPGLFYRCTREGKKQIGHFVNGKFKPKK